MAKKGRSAGEGTVRTRADGRAEARYLIPPEDRAFYGGKTYLYFYGATEAEAIKKRTEALRELARNGPKAFQASRVTFGEWLGRWLASLPGRVAENTRASHEAWAERYLIPELGHVKLRDLTAEHLDGLYRDLSSGKRSRSGRPLAPNSVGKVHATARAALSHAVKKGVVPYNVARDADAPTAQRTERPTLDLAGLARFFEAARGDRLEALWVLWGLTGLRPGEMYALRWQDLRLPQDPGEPAEGLIRRSWSSIAGSKAYMRDATKTGKGRPVSLLPEAAQALKAHRPRYAAEFARYRDVWEETWRQEPKFRDLVFPTTTGTPQDHINLNRRHFKPLLKKAGLPSMRPYDLRHSFATLWLESGESAETLRLVLGHSNIATTVNTYSHLSPRYLRESFGRFGDALGGRPPEAAGP